MADRTDSTIWRVRKALAKWLAGPAPEPPPPEPQELSVETVLDEYVDALPSAQHAIDLVPGWNHSLPPETGIVAGASPFYGDPRIVWGMAQFGSLEGKQVLELGPLEASHTYMLHEAGAARVLAIEANKLAFMRCLIVKEILRLSRAEFLLGDCQKWLAQTAETYDLIVACGVLYHMNEPVKLIENMCAHSDAVLIWTHYFDEQDLPPEDLRRAPFSGELVTQHVRGLDVRLHERRYFGAWRDKKFCGGTHDVHYWMEKKDILDLLRVLGFDDIRLTHEQPDHPYGPAFTLFARRSQPSIPDPAA